MSHHAGIVARIALGVVGSLGLAAAAHAGQMKFTFDAPKNNGTVSVFFTDLAGETLSVNANITANMTAAQKRQAIQNAIVGAGLPAGWNVAGAGADLTVTNNANLSMVANFNPKKTGELLDRQVVPGNRPTTFPGGHGKMDPHAPQGMSLLNPTGAPATFNAGVVVGGVDYIYSIAGNHPLFGGAATVSELVLTNILYNGLTSLALPSGLAFSNLGSAGIRVDFDPSIWSQGDYGIAWGTDSVIGGTDPNAGFIGEITSVPTPGTAMLFAAGMVSAAWRRRARA